MNDDVWRHVARFNVGAAARMAETCWCLRRLVDEVLFNFKKTHVAFHLSSLSRTSAVHDGRQLTFALVGQRSHVLVLGKLVPHQERVVPIIDFLIVESRHNLLDPECSFQLPALAPLAASRLLHWSQRSMRVVPVAGDAPFARARVVCVCEGPYATVQLEGDLNCTTQRYRDSYARGDVCAVFDVIEWTSMAVVLRL